MACPGISHPVQKHDDSEKVSVRKQALRARESLSFSGRDAGSRCVVERITALPAFRAAHTVMLYRAVRGELSLDALPGHPAAAGKRFVYPRCVSGTEMKAMFPGGWEAGAYGIPEPAEASSEVVLPEEIGLVVCPGAAFDDRGIRLGMGAGYYDRGMTQYVPGWLDPYTNERGMTNWVLCRRGRPGPCTCGILDLAVTEKNLYLFPGRKERKDYLPEKTVRVVAAVLCHEGRVFAARRGYGTWKDYWEFPGGKIEPGETPEEALAREIREELDTEVSVGKKMAQVEYDYPDFHLSMGCFACRIRSGSLTLKEHESARWLMAEEMDTVDWLPADLSLIRQLRDGGLACD